jgi:hypothetical protein
MSSPIWRWLLGVEQIPESAPGLRLAFEHPLPAWAWVLASIAAATAAWLAYRRLPGSAPGRAALGSIRTLLLLWLLAILAGPTLVLPRERIERDRVILLVDRSASLGIADVRGADGSRRSREAQLQSILEGAAPVWGRLAEEHELLWLGFDGGAFELSTRTETGERRPWPTPSALGEPEGVRTRIGRSIGQSLDLAAGRPIAGVVLLSDGRTTDPPDRALLRRLEVESIPVFTVPLGSGEALGDVAISLVEAPRRAFPRDRIPVTVQLASTGSPPAAPVEVRLVDADTRRTLARVAVPVDRLAEPVVLSAQAPEGAAAETLAWRVEIDPGVADLVEENDRQDLAIEVVDRPVRVLYVEGSPRWEYRFLKSLLVRESSVESSIMLLSADRDFAQEGDRPIARLPRSPEEFADYDLLMLGDLPAGFFAPSQLEMIREQVATRGAGLLVIGGPRHTPRSWERTPLAEMLPFAGPLNLAAHEYELRLAPTDLAARLGILELDEGTRGGWPAEMLEGEWARLRYAQRIDPQRLKPTAEVLAEDPDEGAPLLIRMRYGAGQVLYLATDESWRWRYGRGETLPERFWVPLLRLLGREALAADAAPLRLRVGPARVAAGEPVSIELELTEGRGVDLGLTSVAAVAERDDGAVLGEFELLRASPTLYSGTWTPQRPGRVRIRIVEPEIVAIGGTRIEAEVEAERSDEEWRRPDADHALLAEIAEATGGALVPGPDLSSIADSMPNRSVVVSNPLVERIWSSPLALLVAVLLLTIEWLGRRSLRLA